MYTTTAVIVHGSVYYSVLTIWVWNIPTAIGRRMANGIGETDYSMCYPELKDGLPQPNGLAWQIGQPWWASRRLTVSASLAPRR